MEQLLCIVIGYICGNFLTAELVVYRKLRKSAKEIGTGNPGMANVMQQLGFKSGIEVLAGDLLKTILSCVLCLLIFPTLGRRAILYAGIGTILGHNYPIWNRFRGGKGVAVTCTFLVMYSPIWGLLACVIGMISVFISCYLTIGALIIPAMFLFPAFYIYGREAGIIALFSFGIMCIQHFSALLDVIHGRSTRVDVLSKITGSIAHTKTRCK